MDWVLMVKGRGAHRFAACAALEYDPIPGRFYAPYTVDVKMSRYWPQVRRGIWSDETASAYFDHLFDSNPLKWAQENSLVWNRAVPRLR